MLKEVGVRQLYLVGVLLLVLVVEAPAASDCYNVQDYPAVHFLGLNEQGFPRVALVGKHIDRKNLQAPILEQTPNGWIHAGNKTCQSAWHCFPEKQKCQVPIPKIELTLEETNRFGGVGDYVEEIEQKVSDCVQAGDEVYFGIEFYEGEGVSGLGGIGKYNTRTGAMEIRRPPALLETSVTDLAFDGNDLWISASSQYECTGRVPVVPLMRYNWKSGQIYSYYMSPQICGFNVQDIHYENNQLYVAADIGFTSMEIVKPEDGGDSYYSWQNLQNWVPVESDGTGMRSTSCDAVYDHMLATLPVGSKTQLIQTLLKFKPEYMTNRILKQDALLEKLKKD